MTAEHLVASALQTGRAKDFTRLLQFIESGVLSAQKLDSILKHHGLPRCAGRVRPGFVGILWNAGSAIAIAVGTGYIPRLVMAIVTDYHMHTPLCLHARGPLEGYVEHAIHLGLREIGFADHNPLPDGRGANVRMKESELDYYVNRVIELQYQYRGKIDIRLGLELDYVKGLEDYLAAQVARYPWDYIIGSIHYLDPECRQGSWPHGYQGTVADLYGPYFSLMRKLAQTGFCDIIAHFDVPKRSGCFLGEAETGLVTDMLQAIARAGLCMEINTSGYRHPELPAPQPYPSLPIVKQALALGIPLAVNSDAHDPDTVGLRFGEVETWLRQHGCQKLMRFDRRQRTEYVF